MRKRAFFVCAVLASSAWAGPVDLNPLTGELTLSRVDLTAGEGPASYRLRRSYRPLVAPGGWHWSCDTRLEFRGAEPVWIDEDGGRVAFVAEGRGWQSAQGSPLRLRAESSGFSLETPERAYRFDLAGRLVARTTRGVTLELRHGPQGAVAVVGPWGELTLERGADGVQRAALEGAAVRYAYRAGRLAGMARGARRERLGYDALGRLNQVDDTAIAYDDAGRVRALEGGRVPVRAEYAEAPGRFSCALTEGARETRYTLHRGPRTRLEVSEGGATKTLRFDARLRPVAAERDGVLERSWRYDARGRLTELHTPGGDLRLAYEGSDRPTRTVLPGGDELRFVYDDAGRVLAATSPRGTERFAYDPRGQLIKHQDTRGTVTRLARDARGYLTGIKAGERITRIERSASGDVLRVQHPDGRVVEYTERGAALKAVDGQGTVQAAAFDEQGRMIAYQDEFGRASRVAYNGFGLIARSWDKDGERFRCDYDAQGQLIGVVDAAGNQVRYRRPDARTLIVEDPSSGPRELRFDAEGRVVEERRGDATLRFRYDAHGRLLERSTPAGSERFTYDAAGRLLSQAGPDGELRYTYDAQGRLASCENRVLFERVSYRYRGADREPSEVVYPWGSVRYRYDAQGRLTGVEAGDDQVEIERDAAGRRSAVRYANGVETRYAYAGSLLSEVSSWRGDALLSRRAYRYDARGRVTSVTDERGVETRSTHDRRGRLLSEASSERSVRYTYDAAGNRTAVEVDGETQALEVGAGNRVLAQGETSYTYGSHGALSTREDAAGTWRYRVDVDGRLRSARGPGGQRVSYGYAPDGTPLWREADGERQSFLVDRQQVVGEFTDGALTRSYVRGEGLDDLLFSRAGEQSWTFHRDLVGSVTALSDGEGQVVARYRYGAFGQALSAEGPAAAANRWRFAGRPLDAATGLYDVRARHYDASLGRFTAPDPSGRAGGLNLYAYAENDPTRLTDPLGLSPEVGTRASAAPAPQGGWFSRLTSKIDELGQSLPGPLRVHYNLTKGVAQAARDTVVGVGELFKKETWVALGDFVSELDDWETVKAVGQHLLDSGIDVGRRYLDAALNDPDEFARMTGYGGAMIAGSILGTKGIDKLAKVAKAAKAARAAARAADVAGDANRARRRILPIIAAGANAGEDVVDVAEDVARAARAGSREARPGIAQALDPDAPLGSGGAAAPKPDPMEGFRGFYQGLKEQLDEPISPEARRALGDRSRAAQARAADLDDVDLPLLQQERMGGSGTLKGNHGGKPGTDGASIGAANFRRADELVKEWAERGEPLTVERIQELNRVLGDGLAHNGRAPGVLRSTVDETVSAGGAPAKVYVLGDEVAGAMDDFMAWFNAAEAAGMDPIELAAGAYQRLVSIHPFFDGNGRTSRMVMDYVLRKNGLPPALLSDPKVAAFGAQRAWGVEGLSTTPEQALAKVTEGVERSLDLLGAPR